MLSALLLSLPFTVFVVEMMTSIPYSFVFKYFSSLVLVIVYIGIRVRFNKIKLTENNCPVCIWNCVVFLNLF